MLSDIDAVPIFRLNEYCWDHILNYISPNDVVNLTIVDPRFMDLYPIRSEMSTYNVAITRYMYRLLCLSKRPDQILTSWGSIVFSITLEGNTKASEDDWQRILPHFTNLTELRLHAARLNDPDRTIRSMPVGLTSLTLKKCSIWPTIQSAWFRKLDTTLVNLTFMDFEDLFYCEDVYEENPKPFRAQRGQLLEHFQELKQIETLTTNHLKVLKYLPMDKLKTVLVYAKNRMYDMTEEEWKCLSQAPELTTLYIGHTTIPSSYREPIIWNYKLTKLVLDKTVWFGMERILQWRNLRELKLSGYCDDWRLKRLYCLKNLEDLICDYANVNTTTGEILKLIKMLPKLTALALIGCPKKIPKITDTFMMDLDQYLLKRNRKFTLRTEQDGIVSGFTQYRCFLLKDNCAIFITGFHAKRCVFDLQGDSSDVPIVWVSY